MRAALKVELDLARARPEVALLAQLSVASAMRTFLCSLLALEASAYVLQPPPMQPPSMQPPPDLQPAAPLNELQAAQDPAATQQPVLPLAAQPPAAQPESRPPPLPVT